MWFLERGYAQCAVYGVLLHRSRNVQMVTMGRFDRKGINEFEGASKCLT